MKKLLFAGLALGLLVTAGAASAQGSGVDAAQTGMMDGASGAYGDAMRTMDEAMAGMKMTGDAGVDFAAMMIPHHQSAIDMAKAYLASENQDAELTALASEIVASQQAEIETLQAWLDANR